MRNLVCRALDALDDGGWFRVPCVIARTHQGGSNLTCHMQQPNYRREVVACIYCIGRGAFAEAPVSYHCHYSHAKPS